MITERNETDKSKNLKACDLKFRASCQQYESIAVFGRNLGCNCS